MLRPRSFTVGHLHADEGLAVICVGCGRRRVLGREELIALVGPHASLEDVARRLRCAACGGTAREAWVSWPRLFQ